MEHISHTDRLFDYCNVGFTSTLTHSSSLFFPSPLSILTCSFFFTVTTNLYNRVLKFNSLGTKSSFTLWIQILLKHTCLHPILGRDLNVAVQNFYVVFLNCSLTFSFPHLESFPLDARCAPGIFWCPALTWLLWFLVGSNWVCVWPVMVPKCFHLSQQKSKTQAY